MILSLGVVVVRAAVELVEQRAQLLRLQVAARRAHDQRAAGLVLDDRLDRRVRLVGEDPVGGCRLDVRQHRAVRRRDGVVAHRVGQRPEHVPPREDLADRGLDAAELDRPGRLDRLDEHAGEEVELHREPGAALHQRTPDEAGQVVRGRDLEVAVDQEVLPRDQRVLEDEHGVVLVEAAGERVVERAADGRGRELVRRPADQLRMFGSSSGAKKESAYSPFLIGVEPWYETKL